MTVFSQAEVTLSAYPCHAPGAFPAAVGIPAAQLGPPPIPATTRFPTRAARLRPAPGGVLGIQCKQFPSVLWGVGCGLLWRL